MLKQPTIRLPCFEGRNFLKRHPIAIQMIPGIIKSGANPDSAPKTEPISHPHHYWVDSSTINAAINGAPIIIALDRTS
jgi:hypothetical protein